MCSFGIFQVGTTFLPVLTTRNKQVELLTAIAGFLVYFALTLHIIKTVNFQS
jgi:hypothetical protein